MKRQELIDFLTWYREGSIIYDACGIEIVADQYLADHQQVEQSTESIIENMDKIPPEIMNAKFK